MIVANLSNLRLEMQLLACERAEEILLRSVIRWLNIVIALIGSLVYIFITPHSSLIDTAKFSLITFVIIVILGESRSKYNLLNKRGDYKRLGLANVSRAGSNVLLSLLLSFSQLGLVLGFVASRLVENRTLRLSEKAKFPGIIDIKTVLKRHWRFIKADVPTSVLSNLNTNVDLIGVSYFFGMEFGGIYFMGKRLLTTPMNLIGKTLLDVFKNKSVGEVSNEELKILVYRIFRLSSLVLIIIILFDLNLNWLVPLVLGNEWLASIPVMYFLSIVSFFRFVSRPVSFMFYVREKYVVNFIFQAIHLGLLFASLFLGYLFQDSMIFVQIYAVLASIYYISIILVSYQTINE